MSNDRRNTEWVIQSMKPESLFLPMSNLRALLHRQPPSPPTIAWLPKPEIEDLLDASPGTKRLAYLGVAPGEDRARFALDVSTPNNANDKVITLSVAAV